MKILCINVSPDFSWLTSRGLVLEVTNITGPTSFPLKFLYQVKDQNNAMVDLYTPDVASYLGANYGKSDYEGIMVGWSPSSYGSQVSHTGGYTCPIPLSNGARWMTVRQDSPPNNIYPIHEMMHLIGEKINIDLGDHTPKDFMDSTPVNGQWLPYYENDYAITDPLSNFNQTWKNYIPFLDKVNKPLYKPSQSPVTSVLPEVILTRQSDDGTQTLGDLSFADFSCKTIERPWKDNQPDISCIPKGSYVCRYTFSLSHLGWTYTLQNVPKRSGIRIHTANYYFDLEGCIGLGSGYSNLNNDKEADLINSRITINAFVAKMGKRDFLLTIK